MFEYRYARPALTVDCVVFGLDNDELKILLIERAQDPFKGSWAIPGGFVDMEETPEEAAVRELQEETGLENIYLEQLYTFGGVDRDPRERVVSVAHYALVNIEGKDIKAASDAKNVAWFSLNDIPKLAFDHENILQVALDRLRGKVVYQPIGFELLPPKFALSQLQRLYELVLEKSIDKRNFRKKILKMDILIELDEIQQDVKHRAARLYSFDKKKYQKLLKQGFIFEI